MELQVSQQCLNSILKPVLGTNMRTMFLKKEHAMLTYVTAEVQNMCMNAQDVLNVV